MSQDADSEKITWYTVSRRLQRFIGKLPGGGTIPGGPYTLVQGLGSGTVLLGGYATEGIWSMWSWPTTQALLLVAAGATLIALKFVKNTGRDPLSSAIGVAGAITSPTYGHYRGKPVRAVTPYRVRAKTVVIPLPGSELAVAAEPVAEVVAQDPAPQPGEVMAQAPHSEPKHAQPAPAKAVVAKTPVAPEPPTPAPAGLSAIQRALASIDKDAS